LCRPLASARVASPGDLLQGFPISDVLQPCQMVKDYPGKVPIGDVPRELDGDIDAVVKTHLLRKASGTPGAPAAETDDV
jgi:hypothetical protein